MTKKLTQKMSKIFLAFILVLGGFNTSAAKAYAQENTSQEDVISQVETTDTEALADNMTTEFELVVDASSDITAFVVDPLVDAQNLALETLAGYKVEMDAAIDSVSTLTDEEKDTQRKRYNFYVEMWKANALNTTTVEELDVFMANTAIYHDQQVAEFLANNANPVVVDEAFIAAQIAALATLQTLLTDMVTAIDGLVNSSEAEKYDLKVAMTQLNTLWGTLALESVSLEDLNIFMDDIAMTNARIISEFKAIDAAITAEAQALAAAKAEALANVAAKLTETVNKINALNPLSDVLKQEYVGMAQENANLANSYISGATSLVGVQEYVNIANSQFDAIVVSANLDHKITAINLKIDVAYDIVVKSTHLTNGEKDDKIAQMNAIVDKLNNDMIAVAADVNLDFVATILALDSLFDTSVVALEAILNSIIPAPVTYKLSFISKMQGAINMPDSQMLSEGGVSATVSAPSLSGYIFSGWMTDSSYDATIGRMSQSVEFIPGVTPMPNHDQVIVAQWDVDTTLKHTLTFDLDGAPGIPPEPQVLYGGQTASPVQDPTREGYIFKGWVIWFTPERMQGFGWHPNNFTMPGKDLTVYAFWEKDETVLNAVNEDNLLPNTGLQMEVYSVALLAVLGSLLLITRNRSNKLQK